MKKFMLTLMFFSTPLVAKVPKSIEGAERENLCISFKTKEAENEMV